MRFKLHLACVLVLSCLVVAPAYTFASDVVINPIFIDLEVEGRDSITKDITLKNETDSKLVLYATVNEVAVNTTGEIMQFITPAMTDRTDTVTSWIEITRGRIELEPKETKIVPLTVKINAYAKSGDYHAFIGFVSASKRFEAEAVALRGDANGVILKVAVEEKTDELLRINSFLIDRFVFNEAGSNIDLEIKNEGDSPVSPSGEIIFYNSRGEEISSVPVTVDGESIPGGESRTVSTKIPFNKELGRFKANVLLNYGTNQQAAVFNTTQFFMVPLPIVIGILIAIVIFSLLLTYLLRRAFNDEVRSGDAENELPFRIRNDREHQEKDHDIHIKKK